MKPLTLEALAKFPIVTYDFSFTGRSAINAAFAAKGLEPNVVLTALDSDVIKTYVELGMGVGIIAQMAYDPVRDTQFEKLDADHLFAPSTTRLGLAPRRVPARLRVRLHRALRAALRPRRRRCRARGPEREPMSVARGRRASPASRRAARAPALVGIRCAARVARRCSGRSRSTCTCPRFRAMGAEFGVPAIALQQTLSVYMIAYAFMMLWHGALSDALGRRPVVLAGLAVFALGTLGCAIAGNIQSLWLFRVLQGLSAGSGLVVGRAIIRDRFQRRRSAAHDVADDARVRHRSRARADRRRRALNLLGWRSIFWATGCRGGCSGRFQCSGDDEEAFAALEAYADLLLDDDHLDMLDDLDGYGGRQEAVGDGIVGAKALFGPFRDPGRDQAGGRVPGRDRACQVGAHHPARRRQYAEDMTCSHSRLPSSPCMRTGRS